MDAVDAFYTIQGVIRAKSYVKSPMKLTEHRTIQNRVKRVDDQNVP